MYINTPLPPPPLHPRKQLFAKYLCNSSIPVSRTTGKKRDCNSNVNDILHLTQIQILCPPPPPPVMERFGDFFHKRIIYRILRSAIQIRDIVSYVRRNKSKPEPELTTLCSLCYTSYYLNFSKNICVIPSRWNT